MPIAEMSPGCHRTLYFVGGVWQFLGQLDQLAACVHVIHVFNSHSQPFLRNINTGLDCEDHSWSQRGVVIARIVDIEADKMPKPMDEVFAERFTVKIFAVRVDV